MATSIVEKISFGTLLQEGCVFSRVVDDLSGISILADRTVFHWCWIGYFVHWLTPNHLYTIVEHSATNTQKIDTWFHNFKLLNLTTGMIESYSLWSSLQNITDVTLSARLLITQQLDTH